jgi:hypothetical protein
MSYNSKTGIGEFEGIEEKANYGYIVDLLDLERTVEREDGTETETYDWEDVAESLEKQGFREVWEDYYKDLDGWAVEYVEGEEIEGLNIPVTLENSDYSVSTDKVGEALVHGHMSVKKSLPEVLEEAENRK